MFGIFKKKATPDNVNNEETIDQYINSCKEKGVDPGFNKREKLIIQLMNDTKSGVTSWMNHPFHPELQYWRTVYSGYNVHVSVKEDKKAKALGIPADNFRAVFTSIENDSKKLVIEKYDLSFQLLNEFIKTLIKVCPPKEKVPESPEDRVLEDLLR